MSSSALLSYIVDVAYGLTNCLSCFPSSPNLKLNGRSFKILRLLGEGGFSYVYLVQSSSDPSATLYALKKIRCPFGAESVRRALREVEAYTLFTGHPNMIHCIDHAVVSDNARSGGLSSVGRDPSAGDGQKTVYILLPYYQRGNLQDIINANLVNRTRVGERRVMVLMKGVLEGLKAMHEYRVPRKGGQQDAGAEDSRKRKGRREAGRIHEEAREADEDAEREVLHEADSDDEGQGAASSSAGPRANSKRSQMKAQPLPSDDEDEPLMEQAVTAHTGAPGSKKAWAHRDIKPGNIMLTANGAPILMDLGSMTPSPTPITSRSVALQVADDAAENSTLPYRAPELFDPKTGSQIDTKVDIWSLGCTIYAVLIGKSPFEARSEESGGSLNMCVLNGDWKWPDEGMSSGDGSEASKNLRRQTTAGADGHLAVPGQDGGVRKVSEPVKNIVRACLKVEPSERPDVRGLLRMVEDAIGTLPREGDEGDDFGVDPRDVDASSDLS